MNKTQDAVSEAVLDTATESEKNAKTAPTEVTTRKKSSSAPRKKTGASKQPAKEAEVVLPRADGVSEPLAPNTDEAPVKKTTTRRRTTAKTATPAPMPTTDATVDVPAENNGEAAEVKATPVAEPVEAPVKKTTTRRRTTAKTAAPAPTPTTDATVDVPAENNGEAAEVKATPVAEPAEAPVKKTTTRRRTSSKAAEEPAQPQASEPSEVPSAVVPMDEQLPAEATPAVHFPEIVANVKRSFFARIALILAIVLVFAISTFIYYNRPAVYTEQTDSINFLYVPAEDKTVIVVNGAVRESVQGTLHLKSQNGHGDVCAALIGEKLYVISGKAVSQIAENVTDFVLSANGEVVVYRTAPSFLYYRKTADKSTPSLISRECYDKAYCLSADGKQLVYTAGLGEEIQMRVESYAGTRPYIPAVRGCRPLAVVNGCDFVYYLNADGALAVFDRERNAATVVAEAPDMTSLCFNRDFTELLLVENGKTVLIADGEKQSVFDGKEVPLQLVPNSRVAQRGLVNGTQYMTTTFYKSYYLLASEDGLHLQYLDRKGEWSDVSRVDHANMVTVTDKRVFFMLTNEHERVELLSVKVGKSDVVCIDWDVTSYCPNVDGSRVLYTRDENALYLYRPEFGISRMADSIKPETLTVTADDLFCYADASGALFVSENGATPRVLSDTVVTLYADAHTLYYTNDLAENGTFTVFVNYRAERVSKAVSAGISSIS